jgi:hypothetical protein
MIKVRNVIKHNLPVAPIICKVQGDKLFCYLIHNKNSELAYFL